MSGEQVRRSAACATRESTALETDQTFTGAPLPVQMTAKIASNTEKPEF